MAFYLTMLSSKDMNNYPLNQHGNFKNSFPCEISIHPESEICLSAISFTQHFIEQQKDEAILKIFDFQYSERNDTGQLKWGKWTEKKIDPNEFSTPEQLCGLLNLSIYSVIPRLRKLKTEFFSYCPKTERIWIDIDPEAYLLVLVQGSLLYWLGIESKIFEEKLQFLALGRSKRAQAYRVTGKDGKPKIRFFNKQTCSQQYQVWQQGKTYCTLKPQISTIDEILIHCDVIKNQVISNDFQKILAVITLKRSDDGKLVTYNFGGSRKYLALNSINFTEISIKFTDIHFQQLHLKDPVRIELHVRRKL